MSSTSLHCPEAREALLARAAERVSAGEQPALARHLEGCAACARFAAGLEVARGVFARGPLLSPELRRRALAAALARQQAETVPLGVLVAAAVVAVVGVLVPVGVAAAAMTPALGAVAAWLVAVLAAGLAGLVAVAGSMVLLAVTRGGTGVSFLARREV
jgi:hypothetical protein